MLPSIYVVAHAPVSSMYMIRSLLAVEPILGLIFSRPIPVASAENMLLFFISLTGIRANEKTTIPSPPNHWVSERQNSREWLIVSMSDSTVAPVVVNPDIVSKNALAISSSSMIMNGIIPMTENMTQVRDTIIKLSARVNRRLTLSILLSDIQHLPTVMLRKEHIRYTHHSDSL